MPQMALMLMHIEVSPAFVLRLGPPHFGAECHYAENHTALALRFIMLSSAFSYCYAECRHAKCHYVECYYAEYHYAKYHYSEYHCAECRYAECRGA